MIRAIFAVCLVFHMTECSKLTDDKSFVATFQKGIKNIDFHVDDQWLEYTREIPSIEDFTGRSSFHRIIEEEVKNPKRIILGHKKLK